MRLGWPGEEAGVARGRGWGSQGARLGYVREESLVSFLRKHGVIEIGPKQKGNVLRVVQPTMLQRSVCIIFDAR